MLNIIHNYFSYLLKSIFIFFMNIYTSWKGITMIPVPTIIDITNNYIENQKGRFIKYEKKNSENKNANIEAAFYNKNDHLKAVVDADNELEKTWKRRILYVATPRGNVVMFYDAYKLGFSYYSDSYNLPYALLNSIAMKYVITYKCYDFFTDDSIIHECSPSPLIKIHSEESEKKKSITSNENKLLVNTLRKSNQFAKLKNYKKPMDEKTKVPTKEYNTNRFLCLGKILNFKFTQPIIKNTNVNGFQSKLLGHLTGETNLQHDVLNYKTYKMFIGKKND